MLESSLPVQLNRRVSRRSRPSLAAFTDSGYEPTLRPDDTVSTARSGPSKSSPPPNTTSTTTLPHNSFGSRTGSVPRGPRNSATRRDPFNFDIASQLLAEDELIKDLNAPRNGGHGTIRSNNFSATRLKSPFEPMNSEPGNGTFSKSFSQNSKSRSGSSEYSQSGSASRSATISSAWSGVSNRLFLESIRDAGIERPTNSFTEQFDKLARKHGIQTFPHDLRAEPETVSVPRASRGRSSSTASTLGGNKFWNKLLRRTSTVDVPKRHGSVRMALTHKHHPSNSELAAVGKGKRDSLKGMHLEDMIRLGGVAIFNLPLSLAPGDLLIPTCMHAAASFILNNGLKTAGIFRVTGNPSTTFALYDFYQRQLEENNNEAVVATTALARLPSSIPYTTHDVAHLFKKLIHGLPGGLLGSPAVFQALYNVHTFVYADPELGEGMSKKGKPRMIALALASVNLHFRISLICAVFGLLRAINLASEQETQTKVKDPHETFSAMKDDALATVFGPLLLGDKSAHILVDETEDRSLPKVDPEAHLTLKRSKGKKGVDLGELKREAEKAKRAALVCQMLIDNWEDICYQMKRINALGITAQAYDLPAQAAAQQQKKEMKFNEVGSIFDMDPKPRQQRRNSSAQLTGHRNGSGSTWGSNEVEKEHCNMSHGLKPHVLLPHAHQSLYENKMQDQVNDLIAFSTRSSSRRSSEQMFGELFTAPVAVQPELPTIGEMSPVRELPKPAENPVESSPNWRPLAMETPAQTPIRHKTMNFFEKEEESPNVSVIRSSRRSSEQMFGELFTAPVAVQLEFSIIGDMSPIRELPTPAENPVESSPNWRPLAMETPAQTPIREKSMNFFNEGESPNVRVLAEDTPIRRISDRYQMQMQESPTRKSTPSSGSSTGRGSPDSDMTPQAANMWAPPPAFDPPSPGSEIAPMVAKKRSPPSISLFSDFSPASNITPQIARRRVSEAMSDLPSPGSEIAPEVAMKRSPPSMSMFSDFSPDITPQAGRSRSLPSAAFSDASPASYFSPEDANRRIPPLTFESSPVSFSDVVLERPDPPTPLSAPIELDTSFSRRISPVPQLSAAQHETSTDPEDAPRPLSFKKKKNPSGFSIFQDSESDSNESTDLPPAATLCRPNSRADITLAQKSGSIPLQPATSNRHSRTNTMDSDIEDRCFAESPTNAPGKNMRGNSALYAEIRRLQRLVDTKAEEVKSIRMELELVQKTANAGTLSHIVRGTQEELKSWRSRAEWAEKQLRMRGIEDGRATGVAMGMGNRGHAHTRSMG